MAFACDHVIVVDISIFHLTMQHNNKLVASTKTYIRIQLRHGRDVKIARSPEVLNGNSKTAKTPLTI